MPTLSVIAGPNGSGKSTLAARLDLPGEFVNTDLLAAARNPVHPEAASIEAGRQTLARLEELVSSRLSFTFETTLSSQQSLRLIEVAKNDGYAIHLLYIALRSPALHVARVRQRVALGGHDIPTRVILRRYEKSLSNLAVAMRLAEQIVIYDNTGEDLLTLAQIDHGRLEHLELDPTYSAHASIADLIREVFGG